MGMEMGVEMEMGMGSMGWDGDGTGTGNWDGDEMGMGMGNGKWKWGWKWGCKRLRTPRTPWGWGCGMGAQGCSTVGTPRAPNATTVWLRAVTGLSPQMPPEPGRAPPERADLPLDQIHLGQRQEVHRHRLRDVTLRGGDTAGGASTARSGAGRSPGGLRGVRTPRGGGEGTPPDPAACRGPGPGGRAAGREGFGTERKVLRGINTALAGGALGFGVLRLYSPPFLPPSPSLSPPRGFVPGVLSPGAPPREFGSAPAQLSSPRGP